MIREKKIPFLLFTSLFLSHKNCSCFFRNGLYSYISFTNEWRGRANNASRLWNCRSSSFGIESFSEEAAFSQRVHFTRRGISSKTSCNVTKVSRHCGPWSATGLPLYSLFIAARVLAGRLVRDRSPQLPFFWNSVLPFCSFVPFSSSIRQANMYV